MRIVTGGALEGRVEASPWKGITRCPVDEICRRRWDIIRAVYTLADFPYGSHPRWAGKRFERRREPNGVNLVPDPTHSEYVKREVVTGVLLGDLYEYASRRWPAVACRT